MKMVADHLPNAVKFAKPTGQSHPRTPRGPWHDVNAAMMGAISFQKGLCDPPAPMPFHRLYMHHGTANGIMLMFAWSSTPRPFLSVSRKWPMPCASLAVHPSVPSWIPLQEKLGIPVNLSGSGVTREHLSKLLDVAEKTAAIRQIPWRHP